jgi:hypothetical protein
MRDRDHFETYRRWALDLDQSLDLRAWARLKTGRPQALLSLARNRWSQFIQGLHERGTNEADILAYLKDHREGVIEEAKGFWAVIRKTSPVGALRWI